MTRAHTNKYRYVYTNNAHTRTAPFTLCAYTHCYIRTHTQVSVILQLTYITKFFHWEMGYMNSMDIQHDRAGFYLCWGCLVRVKDPVERARR